MFPCLHSLKPIVRDTSSVSRQVLERVKAIEMIDRHMFDGLRFRQSQIHRNSATPLLAARYRPPKNDTTTGRAKVELDGLTPHIKLRGTLNMDSLAFIVIGPQRTVAPTHRTVTCRRPFWHPLELPMDRAAVTGAWNHRPTRFRSSSTLCSPLPPRSPGISRATYVPRDAVLPARSKPRIAAA
jgi:hypothetical protein